jgi:hypothetical protein
MTTCIVVGGYRNLNGTALSVYQNAFLVKRVVILSVIHPLNLPTENLLYKYIFKLS